MKNETKWYMVTTISGKEEQVIESLKNRVVSESIQDIISEFKLALIPHLTPSGKYKEKNMFPGYIFIKMVMKNEAWFIIRNTQYVTGLVGSSGQRTKPTPVSNFEMKNIKKKVIQKFQDYKDGKLQLDNIFKAGELVEVISGSAKGYVGPIVNVDFKNNVAIVELTLFNRQTPTKVSLDYLKPK